jgi:hypothetical protein
MRARRWQCPLSRGEPCLLGAEVTLQRTPHLAHMQRHTAVVGQRLICMLHQLRVELSHALIRELNPTTPHPTPHFSGCSSCAAAKFSAWTSKACWQVGWTIVARRIQHSPAPRTPGAAALTDPTSHAPAHNSCPTHHPFAFCVENDRTHKLSPSSAREGNVEA